MAQLLNGGLATDERPNTSRCRKAKISPKKNLKRLSTKLERSRKVLDYSARNAIKYNNQRTVTIMKPNKTSFRKTRKRWLNRKRDSRNFKPECAKNAFGTLEEGELQSISSSEDEDDCILVEPTLEEITLDGKDDKDLPTTSDISKTYQSIMDSFKECVSSTPCCKRSSATNVNSAKAENDIDRTGDILPFFVDVGRNIESTNPTESFPNYTKLKTLGEKSVTPHDSARSKETSCDEVIELDDNSNDNADVTMKPNYVQTKDDDSVLFVCETSKNDFIPIVDDSLPPHKILKISEPSPSTPVKELQTNSLFTKSEKKILNAYNQNAYNPSSTNSFKTSKRMVIIDGSNVAFKHGLDQKFSVKGIKIAIEYFEKMGHEVKAVVPQFRMNKSSSHEELLKLNKAGKIVQTPCKNLPGLISVSYDDRFILQLAFATDAAIVSNDNYRDLIHENPAFKKIIQNRVIGYTWCNDIFILPKDPYGKWGPTLETILNRF